MAEADVRQDATQRLGQPPPPRGRRCARARRASPPRPAAPARRRSGRRGRGRGGSVDGARGPRSSTRSTGARSCAASSVSRMPSPGTSSVSLLPPRRPASPRRAGQRRAAVRKGQDQRRRGPVPDEGAHGGLGAHAHGRSGRFDGLAHPPRTRGHLRHRRHGHALLDRLASQEFNSGDAFVEAGDDKATLFRNEGSTPVVLTVTFIAPRGAAIIRDEPLPAGAGCGEVPIRPGGG